MTAKTKTGTAVAAAVLLILLFVLGRGSSTDVLHTATTDREQDAADRTRTIATVRPGSGPATPPSRATPPPPQFAAAAVAVDPPDCEKQLARLRGVASSRADVSPEAFKVAKPSPETERAGAAIVERVLAWAAEKPAYQLECRVSVCRVGIVTDGASSDVPPAWLRALERDPAFGRLRGENRGARLESTRTREALTGRPVAQHWVYFSMPVLAGEEHPFETTAEVGTCAERLLAIQRALEDERTREKRRRDEESARSRRWETTPPNVELTRRVTTALAPLLAANGGPAGTWDCRGTDDCRWHGPAGQLAGIRPRVVGQALAAEGISRKVIVLLEKDTTDPSAETEMKLRLVPFQDGGAPAPAEVPPL